MSREVSYPKLRIGPLTVNFHELLNGGRRKLCQINYPQFDLIGADRNRILSQLVLLGWDNKSLNNFLSLGRRTLERLSDILGGYPEGITLTVDLSRKKGPVPLVGVDASQRSLTFYLGNHSNQYVMENIEREFAEAIGNLLFHLALPSPKNASATENINPYLEGLIIRTRDIRRQLLASASHLNPETGKLPRADEFDENTYASINLLLDFVAYESRKYIYTKVAKIISPLATCPRLLAAKQIEDIKQKTLGILSGRDPLDHNQLYRSVITLADCAAISEARGFLDLSKNVENFLRQQLIPVEAEKIMLANLRSRFESAPEKRKDKVLAYFSGLEYKQRLQEILDPLRLESMNLFALVKKAYLQFFDSIQLRKINTFN